MISQITICITIEIIVLFSVIISKISYLTLKVDLKINYIILFSDINNVAEEKT